MCPFHYGNFKYLKRAINILHIFSLLNWISPIFCTVPHVTQLAVTHNPSDDLFRRVQSSYRPQVKKTSQIMERKEWGVGIWKASVDNTIQREGDCVIFRAVSLGQLLRAWLYGDRRELTSDSSKTKSPWRAGFSWFIGQLSLPRT